MNILYSTTTPLPLSLIFQFVKFQTINAPHETKQKDSIGYIEYKGDEVHDKVYRSILKQSYRMFRLFCGTFQSHCAAAQDYSVQPHELINKLNEFYTEVRAVNSFIRETMLDTV